jgi:hypothetical protein
MKGLCLCGSECLKLIFKTTNFQQQQKMLLTNLYKIKQYLPVRKDAPAAQRPKYFLTAKAQLRSQGSPNELSVD